IVGDQTTQRCVLVQWPLMRSAYNQNRGNVVFPSWHGSLLQGKRDRSGLEYRRNRQYDPQSGRFTQEDPIGLAGGLNLYGFASGDPINLSDPFGLCPEDLRSNAEKCDEWNQQQAGVGASYFNKERARGNPGTRFVSRELPKVRGVNSDDLMLLNNCGGGEPTTTGCTRIGSGGVEIVVNADRPIPAIATTLAHENVHAAGFDMTWEGYAQHAARAFVLALPQADRLTAEIAGAGPRPTHLIFPFLPLVIR
ncbi:MAG: RHS repeat-associated core domain-containing protein, partial [bacterium]